MRIYRFKADCTFAVGGDGGIDDAMRLLAMHFDKLAEMEESPLQLETGELRLEPVSAVVGVEEVARAVDEVSAKRRSSATVTDAGTASDK